MFAEPPLSPYKALRNLKKSVDTIGNLLIPPELWKQQQDIINGIKDVYQIREKLVPRLFTASFDNCNLILNAPYGTFIIRNPACVPVSTIIPYESGANDAPFVPPPQDGGSGRYIFISSGYQKFYDKFNNGTAWINSERYWNHLYIEGRFPDNDLPVNNARGDFNVRYWKSEIVDASYSRNPNPTITTNYLTLDFYTNNYPGYTTYQENGLASLPAIKTMAAGLTYAQALAYAQTTDGKNYYYYSSVDRGFGDYRIIEYKRTYQVFEIGVQYIEPPPPPSPPKKKKDNKEMACCQLHTALLVKILKKLGDEDLPASVPALLTKPDSGNIQIQNLAQFISYTVKQLDALAGKYPIDIQIEDSDLTQEGNQTQELKIPNIAEALAEILGILLILRSESDANLSATVRGMIEAGSAKQAATLAVDYGKANAEFLGYKGKQVKTTIPMAFNPNEEKLDKILFHTTLDTKTWENDDKQDLNDLFAPLLELAAMWKAQNFRKVGTADTSTVLRNILRSGPSLVNAIDNFKNNPPAPPNQDPNTPPPAKPINEWDQTLEEIEQGFINKSGISDTLHPYGRELERRPRIREIGTDTGNEP